MIRIGVDRTELHVAVRREGQVGIRDSSSGERAVTEDIDGDSSATVACDTFASATRIGTMTDAVASAMYAGTVAGATAYRAVLVSSVPLGAFAGGRGGL